MDKIARYREIIQKIVEEFARPQPSYADVRVSPIVDTLNDHYGVVMDGWENDDRVHGVAVLVDIINEKFWVQYDGTYPGVVDELLDAGVPKEDIVLAFHPPEVRQYTDFAVG